MKVTGSILVGCAVLALVCGNSRAQVKKKEIIAEIQAAFDTWGKVPCTNLKFEYKGEQPAYVSELQGYLLVYFGYDRNTWANSDRAYQTSDIFLNIKTGEIVRGVIGFNAYNYDWTIGKEKNTIDIRTAVTRLIPFAIGYYVGPDSYGVDPQGIILRDFVDYTLLPLQVLGAQFLYFSATQPSCVQPGQPPICGKSTWTMDSGLPAVDRGLADRSGDRGAVDRGVIDRGPAAERSLADLGRKPDAATIMHLCIHHSSPNDPANGKPLHWPATIPWTVFIPDRWGRLPGGVPVIDSDAGANRDVGQPYTDGRGGGKSDGCCRVSHAGVGGAVPVALLLLALLIGGGLLARSRRRR